MTITLILRFISSLSVVAASSDYIFTPSETKTAIFHLCRQFTTFLRLSSVPMTWFLLEKAPSAPHLGVITQSGAVRRGVTVTHFFKH